MPEPTAFAAGFREIFADYRRLLDPFVLFRDPPDHTRLRGLVNRGFTPSAIEGLRPRVAAFVDALLAAMPASGAFDFVPSFAYPLPARVIAELIGVPESILDDLKRWSDGFATSTAGTGEADLRANLDDAALMRNTVEEMLRHDGALFMSMRVALQSFAWHGRPIEAGQRVFLYHLSANRDPRVFEQPERFDIRRKDAMRHAAFGYGIHFCLGAPLARLEVEVALPALLRRYADLALVDDSVTWKTNFVLRGPTSLMLSA